MSKENCNICNAPWDFNNGVCSKNSSHEQNWIENKCKYCDQETYCILGGDKFFCKEHYYKYLNEDNGLIWVCTDCKTVYVNESKEFKPHINECEFRSSPKPFVPKQEYDRLFKALEELLEINKKHVTKAIFNELD